MCRSTVSTPPTAVAEQALITVCIALSSTPIYYEWIQIWATFTRFLMMTFMCSLLLSLLLPVYAPQVGLASVPIFLWRRRLDNESSQTLQRQFKLPIFSFPEKSLSSQRTCAICSNVVMYIIIATHNNNNDNN